MEKVVKLVKYGMKICSKKDWSHLHDGREEAWSGRSEVWTEHVMSGVFMEGWINSSNSKDIPSENESEPVDIQTYISKRKRPREKERIKVRSIEEGISEDEFSSTEEITTKVKTQRRRRKIKKRVLRESQGTEQLLFAIEM